MIDIPNIGIIVDNFFDHAIYSNILEEVKKYNWEYGWQTNDKIPHYIFNKSFYDLSLNYNRSDISNQLPENILQLWKIIQNHFGFTKLIRCYANMTINGLDAYPHYDSHIDGDITVILYLCGPYWNIMFGGETVIYDKDFEIISSVVPKENRILAFKGNMLHCARSVTKACSLQRITLMFKATYSDK